MKLSAPTKPVFIVAVLLGLLGILAEMNVVPISGVEPIWLLGVGFVLLTFGTMVKGF